jgi:hypothetical protein
MLEIIGFAGVHANRIPGKIEIADVCATVNLRVAVLNQEFNLHR